MSDKKTAKEFFVDIWTKLKVFWKTPPKGRYMNLKEIVCFGGSAFGVSTMVTVVSGLITATQIPGIYDIDVIHGAYICLIASVLGLIIQPFFGKLLQNTNTKFGRYKPFILGLAPIFAVFAIAATWQPQNLSEQARTLYAYLVCSPTLIIWNLFQNTFYMMPGVVTPNQQERTDIWAPIGLVIGFSPTVMNVLGGLIKAYFNKQGMEYMAYRYLGFIYAIVGFVLVLCLFLVKERVIVTNENKEKVGLFEGLGMIMKNKPLLIFTLALILGSCRTMVEVDAEVIGRLRYATDIDKGLTIFSTLTMITGFAVTPNMILLPLMTRKLNNRDIIMIWMACNTIGYLVLGIVGLEAIPQGAWSAVIITALRFISLFNAIASLQPLMMAEICDYQQLKTGKRLEGFIQMFMYALVLVFTNIGLVVAAYVKQGMNYQPSNFYGGADIPTQEEIAAALRYFRVAFIVSAVSAALMFIVMLFYKLGKKEHAEIVEKLRELGLKQGNEQVAAEEVGIAETSKQIEEEQAQAEQGENVVSDSDASENQDKPEEGKDGGDNSDDLKF